MAKLHPAPVPAQPLAGHLTTICGNRCGMLASAITMMSASFLVLLLYKTETFWVFFLLSSLQGGGFALFNFNIMDISTSSIETRHRGKVLASAGGVYRLGGALGPLALSLAADNLSMDTALVFQGCVVFLALVIQQIAWGKLPDPIGKQRYCTTVGLPRSNRDDSGEELEILGGGAGAGAGGGGRGGRGGTITTPSTTTTKTTTEDGDDDDDDEGDCVVGLGGEEEPGREGGVIKAHLAILRDNGRTLFSVGLFSLFLQLVRSARNVLLPLTAAELGCSVSQLGAITSVSFACGVVTFPLSGIIMDKYGRRTNASLALLLFGIAFFLLGFAEDFLFLFIVGIIAGLGNGMSSGLVMTLGSDVAPREAAKRSRFIGMYRILSDSGSILGPLISAAVLGLAGVVAASYTMLSIAVAAFAYVRLGLQETATTKRH